MPRCPCAKCLGVLFCFPFRERLVQLLQADTLCFSQQDLRNWQMNKQDFNPIRFHLTFVLHRMWGTPCAPCSDSWGLGLNGERVQHQNSWPLWLRVLLIKCSGSARQDSYVRHKGLTSISQASMSYMGCTQFHKPWRKTELEYLSVHGLPWKSRVWGVTWWESTYRYGFDPDTRGRKKIFTLLAPPNLLRKKVKKTQSGLGTFKNILFLW